VIPDGTYGVAREEEPSSLGAELRAIFAERNWGYHERGDQPALISELSGPLGHWDLLVQVDERARVLVFYSVLPLTVPEEARPAIAEYAARVNHGLSLGSFELDYGDGTMRSKITLPAGDAQLDGDLIERCIRTSGRLTELYIPKIQSVIDGADPADAAAKPPRRKAY
jgi:hypothetical protein